MQYTIGYVSFKFHSELLLPGIWVENGQYCESLPGVTFSSRTCVDSANAHAFNRERTCLGFDNTASMANSQPSPFAAMQTFFAFACTTYSCGFDECNVAKLFVREIDEIKTSSSEQNTSKVVETTGTFAKDEVEMYLAKAQDEVEMYLVLLLVDCLLTFQIIFTCC